MLLRWIQNFTFLNVSLNRVILKNQVKTLFLNGGLYQDINNAATENSLESVFNGDMVKRKPPDKDLTNQPVLKMANLRVVKEHLCSGDVVISAKTDGKKMETGADGFLVPVSTVSTSFDPPDPLFSILSNTSSSTSSSASNVHAENYGIQFTTDSLSIKDSMVESSPNLKDCSDVSSTLADSSSFQPVLPNKDSGDFAVRDTVLFSEHHIRNESENLLKYENIHSNKNDKTSTSMKSVIAKSEVIHKEKSIPVYKRYPVPEFAAREPVSVNVKQTRKMIGKDEKYLNNEKRKGEIFENARGIRTKFVSTKSSRPFETHQTRSRNVKHIENKNAPKTCESVPMGPKVMKTKISTSSLQNEAPIGNNGKVKELSSSSKSQKCLEGNDAGIKISLDHVKSDKVFHDKLPSATKKTYYFSQPLVKKRLVTSNPSKCESATKPSEIEVTRSNSKPSSATKSRTVSVTSKPSSATKSRTVSVTSKPSSAIKSRTVSATSKPSSAIKSRTVSATSKPSSDIKSRTVSATSEPSSDIKSRTVSATSKPSSATTARADDTTKTNADVTPKRLNTSKEMAATKPNRVTTSKGNTFSKNGDVAYLRPTAVTTSTDGTTVASRSNTNTSKSIKFRAIDGKQYDKFSSSKTKPASLKDNYASKHETVTASEKTSQQRYVSTSYTISSSSSDHSSSCYSKPGTSHLKSSADSVSTPRINTIRKHKDQPSSKPLQDSGGSSSTNSLNISTKKNMKSSVLPPKLLEEVKETIKRNVTGVAKQVLVLEMECSEPVIESQTQQKQPLSESHSSVCSEDVKDEKMTMSMVTDGEDTVGDGAGYEMSAEWCLPFGDAELDDNDGAYDISPLFSNRFDLEYKRSIKKAAKKKNKKEKYKNKDRGDRREKVFDSQDTKPRKPPPNYFIAVQVANTQIHEKLAAVQKSVLEMNKDLHPIMNPIPTVHLTLMVMRLDSDDEMYRACLALDKCGDILKSRYDTGKPLELNICGLGTFRNQVVFAKVTPGQALEELESIAESVEETMKERAILPTDNKGFKPHVTIMKMSRASFNFKKTVAKCIDPDLYKDFQTTDFGLQEVSSLQLCAMLKKKTSSGYYQVEHEVTFGTKHSRMLNEDSVTEIELHKQSSLIVDISIAAAKTQLECENTGNDKIQVDIDQAKQKIQLDVKDQKQDSSETNYTQTHQDNGSLQNEVQITKDAVDNKYRISSEQSMTEIETLGDTLSKACMKETMNTVKDIESGFTVDDKGNLCEIKRDEVSQCQHDVDYTNEVQEFSRKLVKSAIEGAVLQVKKHDRNIKTDFKQDKKKNTEDG